MKNLVYYIWKNRLFPLSGLKTTSGENIRIIDNGKDEERRDVFNNAKIRIGNNVWAGNVILHNKSSDWEHEMRMNAGHKDNVILHVTLENDCDVLRRHGEEVQQLCLHYSPALQEEISGAIEKRTRLSCAQALSRTESVKLHNILSRLLVERMEEKARKIEALHMEHGQRWEETLFRTMVRSFGFSIQGQAFEEWANTLDLTSLGKHRDNPVQIEAAFFGQAGLLEEESIPYYYRECAKRENYYNELKREYAFLERKFNLKRMDYRRWGNAGMPHQRIARLAAIYYCHKFSLSYIAECNTTEELRSVIDTPLHGYWHNHLCFGGTETCGSPGMKQKQVEVIIINAVAPVLYVYGKHRKEDRLCEKAEDILHTLKCEENSIVRRWKEQGISAECAADSQALLQLSKYYCSGGKCAECQFAHHYIKSMLECG